MIVYLNHFHNYQAVLTPGYSDSTISKHLTASPRTRIQSFVSFNYQFCVHI